MAVYMYIVIVGGFLNLAVFFCLTCRLWCAGPPPLCGSTVAVQGSDWVRQLCDHVQEEGGAEVGGPWWPGAVPAGEGGCQNLWLCTSVSYSCTYSHENFCHSLLSNSMTLILYIECLLFVDNCKRYRLCAFNCHIRWNRCCSNCVHIIIAEWYKILSWLLPFADFTSS